MELTYRGTAEQIKAEKEKAKEWLRAQIGKAVEESTEITSDQKAIYAAEGIEISWESDRPSSLGYRARRNDHNDYRHVWRIRKQAPGFGCGYLRIVIRKDGTLNMKSIMEAVSTQLRQRASTHKGDSVKAENLKLWMAQFGKEPKEWEKENNVDIDLSRTVRGSVKISVRLYPWTISYKGSVRMVDLVPVLQTLTRANDAMKEYEGAARDSKS